MTGYNAANEVIFTGIIPEGIKVGKYKLVVKSNEELEIINVFNQVTSIDKDINTSIEIKVKK